MSVNRLSSEVVEKRLGGGYHFVKRNRHKVRKKNIKVINLTFEPEEGVEVPIGTYIRVPREINWKI